MAESLIDLLKKALKKIDQQTNKIFQLEQKQESPIAIIGMGCRFPGGANNPAAFWSLLEEGFDSSIEIPKDRWDINEYFDPDPDKPGKMISRNSSFLNYSIADFDANFFGMSPREAEYLDPQQRLLLEVTWEAIENAGIEPKTLEGSSTGVFIGLSSHDYEDILIQALPIESIDAYLGTGNVASTAAGRISYLLGLQGPSLAVDTACSSSLVSLHQACQSLRLGECDKAITGGVNVILSPLVSIDFSQAHMLAADGHCKTFDKSADGYVRGEGCGIIVLKRLNDALRDHDQILAVIKGSAVNQDGASSGLTVPNGPAQEAVITHALAQARLTPDAIDYIEAHGTGTSLGDPIEVNALAQVFKNRIQPLVIGTVKTNIGHLEAAAGIAGIIKTILALQHEKIPRHLNFTEINPAINLAEIPAQIPLQAMEWKKQADKVRRAGVSSFGFSGTNAHVILEEAPFQEKNVNLPQVSPYYLFAFSAKTPAALKQFLEQYKIFLDENPETSLLDLSYSLQISRAQLPYRHALVAATIKELRHSLTDSLSNISNKQNIFEKKDIAFLYSDNTREWLDVAVLTSISPVFANALQDCNTMIGKDHPEFSFYSRTFSIQYAITQFWHDLNVFPQLVAGKGVGFYAACVAAKAIDLNSAFKLVIAHAACELSMPFYNQALVVFAPLQNIEKWLHQQEFGSLFVAEIHGSEEVIISGPLEKIQKLTSSVKQESLRFQQFNRTFRDYREINKDALTAFIDIAKQIDFKVPQLKIIRADGTLINQITIEDCLVQLQQPLKGYQLIDELLQRNISSFIEIGTDENILNWAKVYGERAKSLWLTSLDHREHPWQSLLISVAELFKAGYEIDWQHFVAPFKEYCSKISLPTYPFQRQRFWAKALEQTNKILTDKNLSRIVTEESKYFYQVVWNASPLEIKTEAEVFGNACFVISEPEALTVDISSSRVLLCKNAASQIEQQSTKNNERIVYFVPENNLETTISDYGHLLAFIQKMIVIDLHASLWIITRTAYSIDGSSIIPQQSLFNGFIKTLKTEHPQLDVKQLDIEKNIDIQQVMQWIQKEEINKTDDILVAYRNNTRYTSHLSRVSLPKLVAPLQFDANSYYLITGGLGDLGFVLTGWLIQHSAKHIVLIARRQASESQSSQIEGWKASGVEIIIEHLDITHKSEVDKIIQHYKNGLYPIKGVFHLAGRIDDAPLINQTIDRFVPVFNAKALSAWYLHEALNEQNITLDYFVLFSSIAAINGSAAQTNYAVANAFLDGLAYYRRKDFLPAITLNWGPWAEIGMAKDLAQQHDSLGLHALVPEKALTLLELALNADPVQLVIADINWQKLTRVMPVLKKWAGDVYDSSIADNTPNYFQQLIQEPRELQSQFLGKIIADNLRQILNLKPEIVIESNQPFYTLGLDSLMGLQLINRLTENLGNGIAIKYEHVLRMNTIALLSAYMLEQLGDTSQQERIPSVSRLQPLALSFAQERLWFLQQLDPSSRAYCEISAIEIKGRVHKDKIENVFKQLIKRHESLRTRFVAQGESAVQIIDETVDWHLDYKDLSSQDVKAQKNELENLLTTESLKYFDLSRGDLFRCLLVKLSDNDWILSTTLHHIIADGWSIGILIREFALAYNAAIKNETYYFTPLTIQYADYAQWQRHHLTPAVLQEQLNYWKQQLADAELLNLPLDYPRPKMLQDAGSQFHFVIPATITNQLKTLSVEHDVTLYMTLLSALYVLLSRYTNQNDISIGTPVANRTRTEVENVIGFFVNMVVSRINIDKPVSFIDLLTVVKSISLEAYAHQETPFEKVVEVLVTDRDTSRTALFDVLLVLQNALFELIPIEGMEAKLKPLDAKIAKFDLTFEFLEWEGELRGIIEYRTHLFKQTTIERMAEHFVNILKAVTDPTQVISTLDFLGIKEKNQLLIEWNNTARKLPVDLTVVQWFEKQVQQTPENLAVILDEVKVSYFELNKRANQLAYYFKEKGVGPEVSVALCMDRSIEFIISLLAVLKAGGAYLPIDPSYPLERIEYMLKDSNALLCLSLGALDVDPALHVYNFHQLDLSQYSNDNPFNAVKQANAAYIIYTSGSTGKPKGVVLTHISLFNFMQWLNHALNFIKPMRLLHKTSVGFDVAVSDIFTPLLQGGTVIIAPPGEQYEPEKLLKRIKKYEVTFLEFVPSQLLAFLDEPLFNESLSLQAICLGGEALTRDIVDKYFKQMQLPLLNTYGPTECTIDATGCWIEPADEIITIGKPMDNTQIYILDKFNNLLPIGAVGELCIGGVGLAREYLNRPELTQEKFIPNPFGQPGERLYRTGDLARFLDDGRIEYLGRLDNQIKIRGFRIELDEIENRLRSFPDILQALVIAKIDENKYQINALVAYVVTKEQTVVIDAAVLRSYLSQTLPEYMVPTYFIFIEKFPLNTNGKLDRKLLPQPEALTSLKSYNAPETELQKTIVNIFSEVLKIEKVGINDSFFELGGHSLLAIKVINALRKALQHDDIPLSILFRCATPKQIADAIENSMAEQKTDVLCLQSKGDHSPLFMVPGSEGYGLSFIEFAMQFSAEAEKTRPIYTFQYPGLFKDVKIDTLEILANHYIQSLYSIQPEGPYYLLGWSMGGIVAYEMAKQLESQGKEVKFLGIIDITPATAKSEPLSFHQLMISLLFDDRFGVPKENHDRILQEIKTIPDEQLLEYTYARLRDAGSILIQEGKEQLEKIIRALSDNDQLLRAYVVSDTVNNITYFPAQNSYSFPQSDKVMQCPLNAEAWQAWSRMPVNVYPLDGNHFTLWQKPNVQSLIDSIKSWEKKN